MAGEMALPTVVQAFRAQMTGQGQINRGLIDLGAKLNAFTNQPRNVNLGLQANQFNAGLGTVKAELASLAQQVTNAKLGATAKPFWADIAALRTQVAAMSPLDVNVDANVAAALAKIAALKGAVAAATTESLLGAAVADAAGGGGGGGGGGGLMGILGALGWGGGKGIGGFLGGMAGFGSILSLMGFGAEHVVATGIGTAGSIAGAGIGAGFLGLGALGTMGVGMGTDMAGIGQAMGDLKNVYAAMNSVIQGATVKALMTAVASASSTAATAKKAAAALAKTPTATPQQRAAANLYAATATSHLKYLERELHTARLLASTTDAVRASQRLFNTSLVTGSIYSQQFTRATGAMSTALKNFNARLRVSLATNKTFQGVLAQFSPVASKAVTNAAITANAFHMMFNAYTGAAEKTGAKIITQVMKVGMKFLPTIGHFAAQNMQIIKKNLQPFFTWLDNPGKSGGLGILTSLEKVFQKHLPTGMHAMEQGFELLAKTITIASKHLGPFLNKMNAFLTSMNGAKFAVWRKFVNDMIHSFTAWFHFLIGAGKLIFHLFAPAVGLGDQLAKMLTGIFGQITGWLKSISGKNGKGGILHMLFTAHAKELITGIGGIIKAALPLVEQFTNAFIIFASGGAKAATVILKTIAGILTAIDKMPFGPQIVGWGLALSFFGSKALTSVNALMGIGKGILGVRGPLRGFLLGFRNLEGDLNAGGMAGARFGAWVSGLPSKVGAAARAVGNFTMTFVRGTVQVVTSIAKQVAAGAVWLATNIKNFALATARFVQMVAEWVVQGAVWIATNVAMAASATAAFIAENAATLGIAAGIAALVAGIVYLATHWHQVWTDIKNWALDAWHFLDNLFHNGIVQDILAVYTLGLVPLIEHWRTAWADIKAVVKAVLHFFETLPAEMFHLGVSIVEGLWNGVKSVAHHAVDAVKSVGHDIVSGFKSVLSIFSPSRVMYRAGQTTMKGATLGIQDGSKETVNAAANAARAIVKAFGTLSKIKSDEGTIKAATKLLKDLSTALTGLAKLGTKAGGLKVTQIVSSFKTVTDAVHKLVPTLTSLWTSVESVGVGALKTTAGGLKNLAVVFKNTGSMLGEMGRISKDVATATFPAFGAAVAKLAQLLPTLDMPLQTLEVALSALTTGAAKKVSKGLGVITKTFASFTKMLLKLGDVVKRVASMSIPADFTVLETTAAQISAGLNATFAGLKTDMTAQWTAIKNYVSKVVSTVITPLQTLHTKASGVATKLKGVWTKITSDLHTGWSSILAFDAALPTKLEAPFKGIRAAFVTIGQQIMQGLQAGMSSLASAVASTAAAQVTSIITSMKKAAKIKSPSAVAATTVGVPIGQGIVKGLQTLAGILTGAGKSAVQGVLAAASVAAAAGITVGKEMVTGIAAAIKTATPAAVDAATVLGERIAAALKAGLTLKGIAALGSSLTSSHPLGAVAQAAAKAALGITSPLGHVVSMGASGGVISYSRTGTSPFIPAGFNFGQQFSTGVAAGITSGTPKVLSAVRHQAAQVAAAQQSGADLLAKAAALGRASSNAYTAGTAVVATVLRTWQQQTLASLNDVVKKHSKSPHHQRAHRKSPMSTPFIAAAWTTPAAMAQAKKLLSEATAAARSKYPAGGGSVQLPTFQGLTLAKLYTATHPQTSGYSASFAPNSVVVHVTQPNASVEDVTKAVQSGISQALQDHYEMLDQSLASA